MSQKKMPEQQTYRGESSPFIQPQFFFFSQLERVFDKYRKTTVNAMSLFGSSAVTITTQF